MIEKLKIFIRNIHDEAAFFIGLIFVLLGTLFLFNLGNLDDISDILLMLFVPLGILIIIYSVKPESKAGGYGGLLFLWMGAQFLSRSKKERLSKNVLTKEELDEILPAKKLRDSSKSKLSALTSSSGVKKVFGFLGKPAILFAFGLGAIYRFMLENLFLFLIVILFSPFVFYGGLGAIGIDDDILNFTLPFSIQIHGMSYLYFLFLSFLAYLYSRQIWKACKEQVEEEATISGIINWPFNIAIFRKFIEYTYEHEGDLYDCAMPPTNDLMNPYGRLKKFRDEFEKSGKLDERNLAETVTVLINPRFPAIHCFKSGWCHTFYQLYHGVKPDSLTEDVNEFSEDSN